MEGKKEESSVSEWSDWLREIVLRSGHLADQIDRRIVHPTSHPADHQPRHPTGDQAFKPRLFSTTFEQKTLTEVTMLHCLLSCQSLLMIIT